MSTYLLDANHAGTLVTLGHPLRERIRESLAEGHIFAVTVLTIAETVSGFSILPRAERNMREWELIRPTLEVIGIDEQDALSAAATQVALRRHGWQLATVDALIAAIALRHNVILLTTDQDFQPIPGLVKENWFVDLDLSSSGR